MRASKSHAKRCSPVYGLVLRRVVNRCRRALAAPTLSQLFGVILALDFMPVNRGRAEGIWGTRHLVAVVLWFGARELISL
jgi:hypothetical protein